MSRIRISLLVLISLGFSFFTFADSETLSADEPAAEFLNALREKEYYDIAIIYLTSLESSELISEEFRKTLPFEKAETLIKSVSRIRDMKILESRLDDAERLLAEYSAASSSPEIAAKTSRYRGNLRLGRSRLYARQSESDRLTAQEKADLVNKSREMLSLALQDYTQARESLKNTISNFQVDVSDPGTAAKLKQLRSTYTQIRLKLPVVKEQLADSYAKGSPEWTKLLGEAAQEYDYLYDNYRRFAAGLDSGLFAARCYYKIGQIDDALNRLKEIFALENTGQFKTIKRRALALAADCWSSQEEYPANSVIKECEPMLAMLTAQDIRQPDWLRVQLELAKAYQIKATELEKEKGPGASARIREYKRKSAKLIKTVLRSPGDLRQQATELMTKWSIDVKQLEAEEPPPETFLEARQKGEDIVTEIQSLLNEQSTIKLQLSQAVTDAKKQEFQSELDNIRTQIRELTESALGLFELALTFSDEKTELVDINKLRYLQSFCYFVTDQFFESALIAEFILNRYPTVDWTRQAASIGIRSYSALYNKAPEDDREFEKSKLDEICQNMIGRWPGSTESSAAASTMTSLALQQKDYLAAEKYFADVAKNSPSRSALGLKIGQRLWFSYSADKAGLSDEDRRSRLDGVKKHLSQALASLDQQDVTYDAALGSLLLVNAHLATGEVEQAIARLEAEAIAPLDLIKQKHPAVLQSSKADVFKRGVYNTAIDAYLAAMQDAGEPQQWIDKASGIISAMKNDPNSQASLTNTYRRIAKKLKDQFDTLQTPEEKRKFSKSLGSFLGSIEKDSNDPTTVLWAGSTLLSVANSLKEQNLDKDAAPLFKQSVSTLTRAESMNFTGPNSAARVKELRRQRALAERGSGNFEAAVDQLAEILKESPNNLSVQIDAAETLHQWAMKTKLAKHFAEASGGKFDVKDSRSKRVSKVIWGWRKLVGVTGKDKKKYGKQYNKALYHQIESVYQYGALKPDPNAVKVARIEWDKLAKRDPEMGGPIWKPKYAALKQKIK